MQRRTGVVLTRPAQGRDCAGCTASERSYTKKAASLLCVGKWCDRHPSHCSRVAIKRDDAQVPTADTLNIPGKIILVTSGNGGVNFATRKPPRVSLPIQSPLHSASKNFYLKFKVQSLDSRSPIIEFRQFNRNSIAEAETGKEAPIGVFMTADRCSSGHMVI